MVVAVGPQGLASPLPHVIDSIRCFDSTPLPYQRQRPHRTTEKRTSLRVASDPSRMRREEANSWEQQDFHVSERR